ncbi:hypothetical protein [Microbacterium aureliae]
MTRRWMAVVAPVGLVLVLAGCATSTGAGGTSTSPVVSPTPSPTQSAGDGPDDGELDVAWLDDGRGIGIVTLGSGSCRPFAQQPQYADGVLTVQLDDPEGQACTRDFVPRGTFVPLPAGIDPSADLQVVVTGTYEGEADLDGDPSLSGTSGDEASYEPSAGWADDDRLLILTWGSSGCVPVVQSARVADGEVTVTFEDPPADQVCTMDMAPRITVVQVDSDDAAELALAGAEFDGIRLAIAGAD